VGFSITPNAYECRLSDASETSGMLHQILKMHKRLSPRILMKNQLFLRGLMLKSTFRNGCGDQPMSARALRTCSVDVHGRPRQRENPARGFIASHALSNTPGARVAHQHAPARDPWPRQTESTNVPRR
jgi:hypothetical protein